MTEEGNSYPMMMFDQIVDTDFGLLELINERYHNTDTFYWSLLEAPAKVKLGLLYDRTIVNPLSVICKTDDEKIMDDYYNQFIEEEYIAILKYSIVTDMFRALKTFMNTNGVYPTVICKNEMEKTYLEKLDKDIAKKLKIYVGDGYRKFLNEEKYSPIYFKNIKDTASLLDKIEARNIYVAGYRFNFEDDERKNIKQEYFDALRIISKIKVYDVYDKENIVRGV